MSANTRNYRTIKVAPTTRAIRSALALSATLLALSGSGAAMAGICTVTGVNEVSCNGIFTSDVTGTVPVVNVVEDLTLIVGNITDTTVDPAAGSNGITSAWNGDATVISYAAITTTDATGIWMYSNNGTATIDNYGSISADAATTDATGIYAGAYYDVDVLNGGDIDVTSGAGGGNVTGVSAISNSGYTTVTNAAGSSISASGYFGNAYGVMAGGYGATVDNDGDVYATSVFGGVTGVEAFAGAGGATVDNSGTIEAYAGAGGTLGVVAIASGDAGVNNSGGVYAGANGFAYGVEAISIDGTATIVNDGSIVVTSYLGDATGAATYGKYADVDNNGSIEVHGYSGATGIYAYGTYGTNISNDGAIGVAAYGVDALAGGIVVYGTGYVNITNNGTITATSTGDGSGPSLLPYAPGAAAGIAVHTFYGSGGGTLLAGAYDINVVNTGSIYVNAAANANGILAASFGVGSVYVDNQGDVSVYAGTNAYGLNASAANGTVEVQNSGSVLVEANGNATGVFALSFGDNVYVEQDGSVDVTAVYGTATGIFAASTSSNVYVSTGAYSSTNVSSYNYNASGITAASYNADTLVSVDNAGSIYAYAYNNAIGVSALTTDVYSGLTVGNSGYIGAYAVDGAARGLNLAAIADGSTVSVDNSGDIVATAANDYATGIKATTFGYFGYLTVASSGSIVATAVDDAVGIDAQTFGTYADIDVGNSGTIGAYADDAAAGIYAYAHGDGYVYVHNTGAITVSSAYDFAEGIFTYALSGLYNGMVNDGSVDVSGYTYAVGIRGNTNADGAYMAVHNGGSVAVASGYSGAGIYVDSNGYDADIYIGSSGSVSVDAYAYAVGLGADTADTADTTIVNSGDIDVYSYGFAGYSAYGIRNTMHYLDSTTTIDNSGSITVESYLAYAYGISTGSGGDNTTLHVYNSGSIDAISDYGYAFGIYANGGGNSDYVYVDNSGAINATAYYTAVGIAGQVLPDSGHVGVYNTGDVYAYAYGAAGTSAVGIGAYGFDAYVYSGGSVGAYAYGPVGAAALGVAIQAYYAEAYINGAVSAVAISDAASGFALAAGVWVDPTSAYVYVGADGDISAYASGDTAEAIGVFETADDVYFGNAGSIAAEAVGNDGFAYGVLVTSPNAVYASNFGDISASASGYDVFAVGVALQSDTGDAGLYNSGDISASADYFAVGVLLRTDTFGYVYNSGSITAEDYYGGIAIYSVGASADVIKNYGTITGAIVTGAADDYMLNAAGGTWNATGYSDFGDGDDLLSNGGTINLQDGVISMGAYAVNGNGFYNFGLVTADGANYILMGAGNPNPFQNYGQIDFRDGAADDMLTIVGDFAGDGNVNVDVSGLNGTSDILYIEGNVAYATVGTINVDLLDLPDSIATEIPMVYVSGDSTADNFVLGNVNWDEADSFVTLDFGLVTHIDDTNVEPDVFALGVAVTGLSDAGTIAAAIPATVASLMNTQVGTWRQRMGVIDNFNKGGVSLWARIFYDRGDFSPDHDNGNFGPGGNFDYEQMNSGAEGGVDFAVTDEFSIGLLVASARGKSTLEDPGRGTAKVEADTWGVYGTWISPNGFYLDASYRWMNFDVTTESSAGVLEGDGDAEAFNIEVGYAWTLSGGLKIEPQFQWTKTHVDNLSALVSSSGMVFQSEDGDSSRGRLGVAIRKSFGDADSGWLWTPYATLSAVREFDGESHFAVNDTFFGETTVEGTSALLELGATARHGNWAVYGGVNWMDGGAIDSLWGGQLGVRYTFGHAAPPPPPPAPPAKTCADLDDDGDGVNNCDDRCAGTAAGTQVGPDGCPLPPPEPAMEPKPYRN